MQHRGTLDKVTGLMVWHLLVKLSILFSKVMLNCNDWGIMFVGALKQRFVVEGRLLLNRIYS
jgi:hypothetical protein